MNCRFCDFIQGKATHHKNGHPFMPLLETKNTLSFLSIDSPINNDAHILIIPKKHYLCFHDVPKKVQHELSEHISRVGKYLQKHHAGYNILLNQKHDAPPRLKSRGLKRRSCFGCSRHDLGLKAEVFCQVS